MFVTPHGHEKPSENHAQYLLHPFTLQRVAFTAKATPHSEVTCFSQPASLKLVPCRVKNGKEENILQLFQVVA